MGRQSPDNCMEHFERLCRERRLPLTVQRRAVLRAVLGRKDHPTADQIHLQIKKQLPDVSRTSVYRILEMLAETGMITKVCHLGSAARFDPKLHRHHHLVCLSCERIIDVDVPRLDNLPLPNTRAYAFQISDYHIHFRGICGHCARQKQKTSARPSRPVGRPRAGAKLKVL